MMKLMDSLTANFGLEGNLAMQVSQPKENTQLTNTM